MLPGTGPAPLIVAPELPSNRSLPIIFPEQALTNINDFGSLINGRTGGVAQSEWPQRIGGSLEDKILTGF